MIVTVLIFSLENRIGFLESQKIPQKTVILSDIFQSGLSNEELYSKVSQLIISITLRHWRNHLNSKINSIALRSTTRPNLSLILIS
jgi:hypothetical protein